MAVDLRRKNIVEQVLHGYRDGHKLLAASVQIDETSSALMSRMSDMQPRSLEKLSSYICAYPLRKVSKYVVSRTWSAHEMRRLGCVWTHSLLADYATIAKVSDLTKLFSLLKRPQDGDFDAYRLSLDITDRIQANIPSDESGTITALQGLGIVDYTEVATALYGQAVNRTLLSAHKDERTDEAIVAAFWNQMPPRLRRELVVCTAANPRSTLPEAEVYLLFSRDSDTAERQPKPNSSVCPDDPFVRLAVDASRGTDTLLRSFLARYVVDAERPRQAVIELVQIAESLFLKDNRPHLGTVAHEIVSSFPSPSDCNLLKKDLITGSFFVGANNRLKNIVPQILSEVLPVMASLRGFSDVTAIDNFLNLVIESDESLLNDVLNVCAAHDTNTLGALVIQRTAEMLPTEFVAGINSNARVKFQLASWNPDLLTNQSFWMTFTSSPRGDEWRPLFNTGRIELFVSGFLNARMFDALIQLINEQPAAITPIIVNQLDGLGAETRQAAIVALRKYRFVIMETMCSKELLSEQVLESFAKDIFLQRNPEPTPELWVSLLAAMTKTSNSNISPFLSYVLFFTAEHADSKCAVKLYGYSFQTLHNLLYNGHGKNVDEIRSQICSDFQPVGTGNEWDFCGRIRASMARHFVRFRSAKQHFLRCATDFQTCAALAKSMSEVSGGRSWLKLLLKENLNGEIYLTEEEISIAVAAIDASKKFMDFF